jgi:hypothetical protein
MRCTRSVLIIEDFNGHILAPFSRAPGASTCATKAPARAMFELCPHIKFPWQRLLAAASQPDFLSCGPRFCRNRRRAALAMWTRTCCMATQAPAALLATSAGRLLSTWQKGTGAVAGRFVIV